MSSADPRDSDEYLDLEQAATVPRSSEASAAAATGLAHSDRGLGERSDPIDVPAAPVPRRRLRQALLLLAIALLAAALAGAVGWWIESERREGGAFGPADEILLMVLTVPHNAVLYVDGLRQRSKSLQLPRVRKQVVLRAEAAGYQPQQLLVKTDITRVVQIVLVRTGVRRGSGPSRRTPPTSRPADLGANVLDSLDRATVQKTLRQLNDPIRACFATHGQPGTLSLRATLHPDGHATGKLLGSFARTKTGACALEQLRALATPRFAGRPLTVDFPFVLK